VFDANCRFVGHRSGWRRAKVGVLFALANKQTGKLFALANKQTGKLFALANKQTGKLFAYCFDLRR
jgi:hypothetical protein